MLTKEVLEKYSDEDHPITTVQIMEILDREYGMKIHRTTVGKDINDLSEQLDLFSDINKTLSAEEVEEEILEKEKNLQKAILEIKKKYGKNAVLKGMNFKEGATMIDRNGQIGGHKA